MPGRSCQLSASKSTVDRAQGLAGSTRLQSSGVSRDHLPGRKHQQQLLPPLSTLSVAPRRIEQVRRSEKVAAGRSQSRDATSRHATCTLGSTMAWRDVRPSGSGLVVVAEAARGLRQITPFSL